MMVEVVRCSFADAAPALGAVRAAVFVVEQGVPTELELDSRDSDCAHVLARVKGAAVGTARLDLAYGGKIGRLAVLSQFRRRGIGQLLLQEIEAIAQETGLPQVWCHAQTPAIPFYQRRGYRVVGEEFLEADIPHRRMEKSLVAVP